MKQKEINRYVSPDMEVFDLEDLEPTYPSEKCMKKMAEIPWVKIGLAVMLFLSLVLNCVLLSRLKKTRESVPVVSDEVTASADTLTDWAVFTLALMKVESEYNPDAVSSAGAKGYFQMTPVYVKEVNRCHKTDYTFDQVTDFDTAYEIFDLMQKAHNPEYDMEKALTLHNGNHYWYHRRVYNEMDRIQKYEEMRNKVKGI